MRDQLILDAFTFDPTWFGRKVTPRLDDYPDPTSCWTWKGAIGTGGHGRVGLPGTKQPVVLAHRVVWLALVGPIPEGLVLDHDDPLVGCHNKACANPAHLAAVTQAINTANGPFTNGCKTHCPAGHPLGGDNMIPAVARLGHRGCRECRLRRAREQSAAIRKAARHLRMSWASYTAIYGHSARVARELIATSTNERNSQ